MNPLYTSTVSTCDGPKTIAVFNCNVLDFDQPIDILTTSAFQYDYEPTPRSVFGALFKAGISINSLSEHPEIDLRKLCHVWLSAALRNPKRNIGRIGCIEMSVYCPDRLGGIDNGQELLNSIHAYFQMLDIAAAYGIKMDTIALPLLGTGQQGFAGSSIMYPILTECIAFLKRNNAAKNIYFIELNPGKAQFISLAVQSSYALMQENTESFRKTVTDRSASAQVFLSYASKDKNIADNLCAKLERAGIKVWYAPRNVHGPYAAAITQAIAQATHFVVILSKNSMSSEHVLNEIDLAFQNLPDKIKFKPLRLDDSVFSPSVKYYLSRQHWMDAIVPPLESRLDEFVTELLADL